MAIVSVKISRGQLLRRSDVLRIGCVFLVASVGALQSLSVPSSFYDASKRFRRNSVAHEHSRTLRDEAVPGVGAGVPGESAKYHGTAQLKGPENGGLSSYHESPEYRTLSELGAVPDPPFQPSELAYDGHLPSRAGFVGMLKQLVPNGKNAFEKNGLEHSGTGSVWKETGSVSFLSNDAYLTTQVIMSTTFSISFKMKTVHRDGLILYGVMVGKACLAVEMSSGHMRYVYINGFGSHLLRTKSRHPINDNQWHDVTIFWNSVTEHILQIDNVFTVANVLSESQPLELHGELYIGGVSHQLYSQLPKKVQSSHGFLGCLSSFHLEGSELHLLDDKFTSIPDVYKDLIKRGCGEPFFSCTQTSCENGGQCVQGIDDFSCICNMTSFTGPTCSDDSIAYGFGERGGVIRFHFPDDDAPVNTKQDFIAFGISTLQSDAVLLRITSVNFKDLIEIELNDGYVSAKYNLGFTNHHLGEMNYRINDDIYHVVRFSRLGASATLQVDDHLVNSYAAVGHQVNIFNSQSEIEVGARRNLSEGHYDFIQPFQGTVVGLVVNGIRVLDLAAEGDKHISIEGDVDLDTKPLKLFQSFPQLLPPGFSIYEDSTNMQFLGNSSINEDEDKNEEEDNSIKALEEEQETSVDDLIFSGRNRFECRYEVPCQVVILKSDAFILPVLNRPTIRQSESKSPMLSTVKPSVSFATSSQKWLHEKTGFGSTGASRAIPCDPSDMVTCRMVTDRASTSQQIVTKLQQHVSSVTADSRSLTLPQRASSEQISTLANVFLSSLSSISEESLARNNVTLHHDRPKESLSVTYDSAPTTEIDFQRVRGSKELETIPLSMNIGLMSGIAISICILIFMLVYAICKSSRLCRHSGVTLHESKNYEKKISDDHKPDETNGLLQTSVIFPRQRDVREWYV